MSLHVLVKMLEEFAQSCDDEYRDTGLDQIPPETNAIVLAALRECQADLRILAHKVEQDLIHTAGAKRFVVDGLGEVEIKKSTKRSEWDHPALIRKLTAMAADERIVDPSSGEYERESDAVARVIAECAGIGYWRVTPLRARRIQVDEYCHEESADYQVRLPPRSKP